jgi:nucleoside-triphosphatase THEP1
MSYKPMIISGRPGSGKTEIVIALCNAHPEKTLLIAEEYDAAYIRERGLKPEVTVMGAKEAARLPSFGFETVCIDYIELLSQELLEEIIKKAELEGVRLVAVSQMRRDHQISNPF